MPHGQCRLGGHDKYSPRPRPPPPRPLKDTRCLHRRTSESPAQPPSSPQGSCSHKRDFAPTGKSLHLCCLGTVADDHEANRFSILANLDQQANQKKWAFDFAQISSNAVRRRGKRAGKNSRPKYTKQPSQGGHKNESDGVEELCNMMAASILNQEDSKASAVQSSRAQKSLPQSHFQFSADVVRHNWMPQFRPNSLSAQSSLPRPASTKPVTPERIELPQSPNQYLTQVRPLSPRVEMPNFKRRESRFFPLSAFLAAPDTAARHPTSTRALLGPPYIPSPNNKQLSVVAPSTTHKAAASATRRAFAKRKTVVPAMTVPVGPHDSRPSSPSPLTHPISPSITPDSLSMNSPFAPVPIIPPLAVSPVLTTSLALSSPPSLTSSSSIVSAPRSLSLRSSQSPLQPPPLPPRPLLSPFKPSLSGPWNPISGPATPASTSPLSLIASPTGTPFTSSMFPALYATPKPSPPVSPPTVSTPIFKETSVSIPIPTPSLPTVTLTGSTAVATTTCASYSPQVQKQLADFLKLGHGDPCWCRLHGDWTFPPQSQRLIGKLPPNSTTQERSQEKISDLEESITSAEMTMHDELVGMCHRVREDLSDDEGEEINDDLELQDVILAPSSTCSSRMSFEDLGDWTPQSPRSVLSENEDEGSDVEWEVVSPGPRFGQPASFSTASTSIGDERESETEGGVLVAHDPTPTPSKLLVLDTTPTVPTLLPYQLSDHWSTNTTTRPESPAVLHIEDTSKFCAQCLLCTCPCRTSNDPSISFNLPKRLSTTPSDSDPVTVFHSPETPDVAYPALPSDLFDPPVDTPTAFSDLADLSPPTPDSLPELEQASTTSVEWPTLQEAMGLYFTRKRARRFQERSSVGSTKSRTQKRRERRSRVSEVSGKERGSRGSEKGVWNGVVDWW